MPDEPRPYDLPRSPALRALHARYIGDDPDRRADYAEAAEDAREEQRAHDAREGALARLRAIRPGDAEAAHQEADRTLLAFLRSVGHGDIADGWIDADERCGFRYA